MLHTSSAGPTLCEPTEDVSLPQKHNVLRVDEQSLDLSSHSPRMELPPLSPGIQARVMEEVEVVETVSRGWSGGTEEETPGVNKSMTLPRKNTLRVRVHAVAPPTLNQKVDDDGVKAQRVGGRARVVAGILGFDRAQHQSPVGQNEPLAVQRHWNGCILTGKQ